MSGKNFYWLSFLGILFLLISTMAGQAAEGDLDVTFGGDGKVTTGFEYSASIADVAMQSDGRIVAVGWTGTLDHFDFAVVRYQLNGILDTSFGNGGKVTLDFPTDHDDAANAVAIQSDGKIVVAGESVYTFLLNVRFAIARYTTNGSLDSTFGVGGKIITDFGQASWDGIRDLAIQTDGKLVAVGSTYSDSTGGDFAIVRYDSQGNLDPSFGVGGIVTTDLTGVSDSANAVALQNDGKILVAGLTANSQKIGIIRYNPNGSVDSSFGSYGQLTTDIPDNIDGSDVHMALQSDGKIVLSVCGYGPEYVEDSFLMRYNKNGILDTTFGNDGIVNVDFTNQNEIHGIAVQPDSKILIAGWGFTQSYDFLLARYFPTGVLDLSFGSNGYITTDFANLSNDGTNTIEIENDQKILLAGGSAGDFALARYIGQTLPPCSIVINPSALPAGSFGREYAQTLYASGGTAPYTFAVTAGFFPDGLTLSPEGVISGIPTAAGMFPFLIAATDSQECSASSVYSLTICTPGVSGMAISQQPSDREVLPGGSVTLSVSVSGIGPFLYQWYQGSAGDTSHPVTDLTPRDWYTAHGVVTSSSYWVHIENPCGWIDSEAALITLSNECPPPSISEQPESPVISAGQTAMLSVSAQGISPLSFQWYRGASGDASKPIGGAMQSVYQTPALKSTSTFWVQVQNVCGATDSVTSTVWVSAPCAAKLRITSQPSSHSVFLGDITSMNVGVYGTAPLNYQWYQGKQGDISRPVGQNSGTFTTPPIYVDTAYWVRITDNCTVIDSTTALATVSGSGPAEVYTKLIPDEEDEQPLGAGRIPLILVHGHNGTEDIHDTDDDYWINFKEFFYKFTNLQQYFKLYRFHYESDRFEADQLGRSLRDHIDTLGKADDEQQKMPEFARSPIVILAHSMGGLVARSYMEEWTTQYGPFLGQHGGDRAWLITLSTPHHGSWGANRLPRVFKQTANWENWELMLNDIDWKLWDFPFSAADCSVCVLNPSYPNRGTLRWDNFDDFWTEVPDYEQNRVTEENVWLRRLNDHSQYDFKIWAYAGEILSNSDILNYGKDHSPDSLENSAVFYGIGSRLAWGLGSHAALNIMAVILERIDKQNFDDSMAVLEVHNDGMVPLKSSLFSGHPLRKTTICFGFDHLRMKDETTKLCGTSRLFTQILIDLGELYSSLAGEVLPMTSHDTVVADESQFYAEAFEYEPEGWAFNKGKWKIDEYGRLQGTVTTKGLAISPYAGCQTCTIEGEIQIDTPNAIVSLFGWYKSKTTNAEVRVMDNKNKIVFIQKNNGVTVATRSIKVPISSGVLYKIKVAYAAGRFDLYMDDEWLISVPTSSPPQSGGVAFQVKSTTRKATGALAQIAVY